LSLRVPPPRYGPLRCRVSGTVNLTPFLDHSELEFSGSIAHGGLVAGEQVTSVMTAEANIGLSSIIRVCIGSRDGIVTLLRNAGSGASSSRSILRGANVSVISSTHQRSGDRAAGQPMERPSQLDRIFLSTQREVPGWRYRALDATKRNDSKIFTDVGHLLTAAIVCEPMPPARHE